MPKPAYLSASPDRTLQGLLGAVRARALTGPADPTERLVLADYLEERGDDRGRLLRCEGYWWLDPYLDPSSPGTWPSAQQGELVWMAKKAPGEPSTSCFEAHLGRCARPDACSGCHGTRRTRQACFGSLPGWRCYSCFVFPDWAYLTPERLLHWHGRPAYDP